MATQVYAYHRGTGTYFSLDDNVTIIVVQNGADDMYLSNDFDTETVDANSPGVHLSGMHIADVIRSVATTVTKGLL